jgi:hypothetical protein
MQLISKFGKYFCLYLLFSTGVVHAEVMKMKIANIKTGIGNLNNVEVEMRWPKNANTGQLRIRAAQLN